MKKFSENKTICFLGDSITTCSTWISIIYDYYIKHFPNSNLKMISCGVSGGRAETGLMYIEEDLFSYNPDHVVIMYGMNETDLPTYAEMEDTSKISEYQQSKLDGFYNDLTAVTKKITDKGISVSFCTNTAYNNWINGIEENNKNANIALQKAADVTKKVAAEFGAEVVDFFACFKYLAEESAKINPNVEVTNLDRVHPNDLGNSIMASIFLNAQGFSDVVMPTPESVADGTAIITETEVMKLRQEKEMKVRYYYLTEWLIIRHLHNKPLQEKLDFIKKYLENEEYSNDFLCNLAKRYLQDAPDLERYRKEHLEYIEKIYSL